MIFAPRRTRKAISPVLATVILIAITLIAAIAIAGFVFGLFGSFTSSATVTASVVTCSNSALNGTKAFCILSAYNSGTANTSVSSCSLTIGGANQVGTLGKTISIPAGNTVTIHCTGSTAGNSIGSMAVGSLSLTNGASVPFTGTWVA